MTFNGQLLNPASLVVSDGFEAPSLELRSQSDVPKVRWFHQPEVVNVLLGTALLAVIWLVSSSWHCAAAAAIGYVAGSYTWFQTKERA